MTPRDYTTAPLAEKLNLQSVISGLCSDLEQLRRGEIGINDALARSALAKQIFNGVRLYLNGTKLLSENAKPAQLTEPLCEGDA